MKRYFSASYIQKIKYVLKYAFEKRKLGKY